MKISPENPDLAKVANKISGTLHEDLGAFDTASNAR
jgi:hypothetical protein